MNSNLANFLFENNGMITASKAKELGVSNKELQKLVVTGDLEHIAFGLYMLSEQLQDDYYIAQYRCPKGIFSYETALYFYGLSDRTPIKLMMTIPTGYNTKLLKSDDHKFYYCREGLYELGVTTVKTPFGNTVKVYNKERTICDCLKKKDNLDKDIVVGAIKKYMGEKGNDYARLLKYAEILKTRDTVKQYMEVLS